MEERPHQIILGHKRGIYSVIVENEEAKELEKHNFASDLLGAIIKAQALQWKHMHNPETPILVIAGFPSKHPNQKTLDDI